VLITGGSSGLGLECARVCAAAGASVTLAVRDVDRGRHVASQLGGDVRVGHLDLADLRSVHRFAERWNRPVDVLLNNAGIMMAPETRTVDGFESHLGVNHLGHFALTGLLLPWVGDRVVMVGSQAHRHGTLVLDDLHWERRRYNAFQAYAQSKVATLLFTLALSRRLSGRVRAVAAHPGWVATDLLLSAPGAAGRVMRLVTSALAPGVEAGAGPLLHAMTEDLPGGSYVGPSGVYEFWGAPCLVGRSPEASDVRLADELWSASVEATGVVPDQATASRRRLRLT
jgi:NAD(P)-dependent dehydrogenase (short-subunit alcohol dehydrogenase family)